MIARADVKDKSLIYLYWKELFAHDDNGSIDFFFNHYWSENNCFVLKKNGELVSGLNVLKHDMMLNEQRLRVSFISGVFTRPQDQGKGYMTELMTEVLDVLSHQDLITMLLAYNPKVYEPFGFSTVMNKKVVHLTRSMIPKVSTMGVTYQVSSKELLAAYQKFTKYFTGFFVRDETYFDIMKKDLEAQNGKLVAYVENNQLMGYMMYTVSQLHVDIQEVVYFNSDTLYRLLNFAASLKERIDLSVSTAEDLSKLFPKALIEIKPWMMARLNDSNLFNKLFHVSVFNGQEAFMIAKKPLFNPDFQ